MTLLLLAESLEELAAELFDVDVARGRRRELDLRVLQPREELGLDLRRELDAFERGLEREIECVVPRLGRAQHRAPEAVELLEVGHETALDAAEERDPLRQPDLEALRPQVEEEQIEDHWNFCREISSTSRSCLMSVPRNGILPAISSGFTPARDNTTSQSSSSDVLGFFRSPSTFRTP